MSQALKYIYPTTQTPALDYFKGHQPFYHLSAAELWQDKQTLFTKRRNSTTELIINEEF
jgi:hypothetical protein